MPTYCGQSITGERIRRKLRGGGIREHVSYRCANNHPGPDHPTVRWKAADVEKAVVEDLAQLRLPTPEVASWFRTALEAAMNDLTAYQRRQTAALGKRKADEALAQLGNGAAGGGDTALALFDWTQRAADAWRGSNNAIRREILDAVCLNRTLSDVTLVTEKRKPFDGFVKRPQMENSRGDKI